MKKRIWSILLVLCMALALFPFGALAADREDFSPYQRLVDDIVVETPAEITGTFFDFDDDGVSELIALRPAYRGYDPRLEIYDLAKDGDRWYYPNMLQDSFHVVTGGDSQYIAAIVENQYGEVGVLLHTEGTNTVDDNPSYQGLIDDYVFDRLYIWRDGRFLRTTDLQFVFWHTEPDANGNVYYNEDQCWFRDGNRDYDIQEFDAWYEKFLNSLSVIAWLSPYEAMDGLNERELMSITRTGFYDVDYEAYYAEPVKWAAAQGITNGTSTYAFSPAEFCTRGQVVTFLWRAAGEPNPKSEKNPFKDVKKDAYYYTAVLWAVEKGITNGTSDTTFSPGDPCTRGQVVTFLYRNAGNPDVKAKNPFKDVKSGAYYYDPVLWAVQNKITNGTSATAFSPDDTCTRGQIVTFLYRGLAGK